MSVAATNVPTNYYYGNMQMTEAPVNYRQKRYDAEVKRQKEIEQGLQRKRTTYNPHPKPPSDIWLNRGKAIYDFVNDKIYPDLKSAAISLGLPYDTVRYRAHKCNSLMFI